MLRTNKFGHRVISREHHGVTTGIIWRLGTVGFSTNSKTLCGNTHMVNTVYRKCVIKIDTNK